ncbi:MAG TPA: 4-hydroxy-3-methylbut-2-enyl diphosphate reductase, partial [Microthrixaceae bacterium]|nr:4-hydroxy-3-methylbut-2-enyl diphosphate reductase [Microthrixaceae bacterium]
LAPRNGVEEVRITDEEEYFPPPRNMRDLLLAIDVLGAFGLGADPVNRAPINDRLLPASSVLADLA